MILLRSTTTITVLPDSPFILLLCSIPVGEYIVLTIATCAYNSSSICTILFKDLSTPSLTTS